VKLRGEREKFPLR